LRVPVTLSPLRAEDLRFFFFKQNKTNLLFGVATALQEWRRRLAPGILRRLPSDTLRLWPNRRRQDVHGDKVQHLPASNKEVTHSGFSRTTKVLGDMEKGNSEGLVPRVIRDAFALSASEAEVNRRNVKLRMSLMEIYRESVTDLLTTTHEPLTIREHPKSAALGRSPPCSCLVRCFFLPFSW
jgi:hypothetical protein